MRKPGRSQPESSGVRGRSGGYLRFVVVAEDDAYPVYLASEPLFDSQGQAVCTQVNHAQRWILVSPLVPERRREKEIDWAATMARKTYRG